MFVLILEGSVGGAQDDKLCVYVHGKGVHIYVYVRTCTHVSEGRVHSQQISLTCLGSVFVFNSPSVVKN